jgi:tRNA dimethylallyltransferase
LSLAAASQPSPKNGYKDPYTALCYNFAMPSFIVLGPTAVGKTKFAIELAKEINGEIISADSIQVYRNMDIGTAKPTKEERQDIIHHLIDICDPDEKWTVADFVSKTKNLRSKIQKKGKNIIIAGGTGLYLWSLLNGYEFPNAPLDKEIRDKLANVPLSILYSRLSSIDPVAATNIHANNKKRIIRALEVYELTGKKISDLQEHRAPNTEHRTQEYKLIGLTLPRDQLYGRINNRVDQMIDQGLIDEVKGLLAKGYSKDLPSMQALGYKEVIEYLEGTWNKDKMIEEIKKRTRHFAKRQETWFKRFNNVKWQDPNSQPLGAN